MFILLGEVVERFETGFFEEKEAVRGEEKKKEEREGYGEGWRQRQE